MSNEPNTVRIGKWSISADIGGLNRILRTAVVPNNEVLASHWPKHDTWTLSEAILLLNGLDPDGTKIGKSELFCTLPDSESADEFVWIAVLDGRCFDPALTLEIENYLRTENKCMVSSEAITDFKHWLWGTLERIQEMRKVFASGEHPDRMSPLRYIELAEAKGFSSEWVGTWRKLVESSGHHGGDAPGDSLKHIDATGMAACQAAILKNPAAPPTSPTRAEQSWKVIARNFATEYIQRHKAQDLHPSQVDVSDHVAKLMREAKIYGPQGKPLTASSIQRETIQGAWWKANG